MEKRRKELAFLAVGALLLGVALYTTFKPRAKPASAEQPKQVAQVPAGQQDQAAEPAKSAATSAEVSGAARSAEAEVKPSKTHRDPFKGAKSTIAAASSSSGSTSRSSSPSLSTKLPMFPVIGSTQLGGPSSFGTLPFAGLMGPGGGTMPGTAGATAGSPQGTAPPDNILRVTGIIEGDPTIAILRKGDARYIVQVADPVQGYVVESISGRRVVLAAGGQKRSLYLGGRL